MRFLEYRDVFIDGTLKFPLESEIEFSISLVPETRPISIAPYRMSPMKLVELKSQLKELRKKKLYAKCQSVSSR